MGFRTFLMLLLPACAAGFLSTARADEGFLEPSRAFALSASLRDAGHVELRFDVAPGYYLYREKLAVAAPGVALGAVDVPRGKVKFDETFGKDVETLREAVTLVVPVPPQAAGTTFALQLTSQGCADKGLCYPPQQQRVDVTAGPGGVERVAVVSPPTPDAPRAGGLLGALTAPPATPAVTPAVTPAPQVADDGFGSALRSRHLPSIVGVFVLAGLLLSFTPCVLPMVPILSSIIVGQSGTVSRARGFSLALAYALGMAIVYTAFGVVAALVGEGLGAALQNPWVLGAFALLLVGLSLSMFGVYELQMPAALQTRLAGASHRLPGGRFLGVFAMGGLSAVIVGPCVAAPLAGALVYISQTRDTLVGGLALFSMALGMSVPLLLVGLSAGTLLPRGGAWMQQVKHVFGLLLLGVALWMVMPVLPVWVVMLAAGVLLLACAVQLGAFDGAKGAHPGRTLARGLGLAMAVLAVAQLVGVVSGGRSVLQPLQHLARGDVAAATTLRFTPVADLAALDEAVRTSSRPVMLDVYADWCVSCKEFEAFTLTDPSVRERLAGLRLLRVDVTANNDADKALLRRYGLFGPPAMLFFPPAGDELSGVRVIGFQSPERFLEHLARVEPLARAQ